MIVISREDLPKLAELAAAAQIDTSELSYKEVQLVLAYAALLAWQSEMFGLEPAFTLADELKKPLAKEEANDDDDDSWA